MDWIIKEQGYEKSEITAKENRFFCGNGYMGIRGALEEYQKEHLPAINLAGIYDKVGDGWREPLNAPNALYTRIKVDGEYLTLPENEPFSHDQELNFRNGLVTRHTEWKTRRGMVAVEAKHFASICNPHLIAMQYSVITDFHADIEIQTGIDGDVWDIHGPHYDSILFSLKEGQMSAVATTHEKKDQVAVAESLFVKDCHEAKEKEENRRLLHRVCYVSDVNTPFTLEKKIAVATTNDCSEPFALAKETLEQVKNQSFSTLLSLQNEAWEKLWKVSEVTIEGDDEAMKAINYSLYHLLSIAPRQGIAQSIAARGLSGQTYKGAVFWDTEMFMLDFFIHTNPDIAKTLLMYRIDTLEGAKKKAKEYGYEGAFYAWESQEGGFDACSDYNVTDVFTGRPMRTFFKDKQIHISAAIVYGLMHYVEETKDTSILRDGGMKTVLECARFYDSLLLKKVHSDVYELRDVIGPDEYHERVNNNGYTNRMAKFVFEEAVELLAKNREMHWMEEADCFCSFDSLFERYEEDAEHIYIPSADKEGIIPQFDGYRDLEDTTVDAVRARLLNEKEYWGGAYGVASHTQIIKQADVVTWMTMFPEDFNIHEKWKNWNYYEPRTEHGSSLSACMYGILACVCGMPEEAYGFFMKTARADLIGGGKEWAGSVYIGGTHPAAAGGAYMMILNGFAGIETGSGKIKAEPKLPKKWKKLRFCLWYQNQLYEVTETPEQTNIVCIS